MNSPRFNGLGAKLVLFSTLLTFVAVAASFVALSLEIRAHTKRLLAETVGRQHAMIRKVQQHRLEQMLRTSTLLTDSPTLRAALEIYRSEPGGAEHRADILETIKGEAEKVASILGRDLLVITDDRGRVLSSAGHDPSGPATGEDLSTRSVVRRALQQDSPVDGQNLAVLDFAGEYFQVGTVPVALQGFVIGALVLGDRMDRQFVDDLRDSFDCEVVLSGGGGILESSVAVPPNAEAFDALLDAPESDPAAVPLLRLGGEEYVTAALRLGVDRDGRPVTLSLLNSLSAALARSNRSLFLSALGIGAVAVVLAGLAAALAARGVLRPLAKFVGFMRSVADQGDHSRRFESSTASHEVRTLIDTYHHLIGSLQEHEQKLLLRAREDLERLERLKESEKLAALGRLLSGAAHEINNPLTGVVGNIEMLTADDSLGEGARRRLATVRVEGQRIVALVRNLLRIAHRSSGDRSLIDLNEVVRDTATLRSHDFATAGMQLRLDLAREPLTVLGSPLELQQVVLNIVNNAFDALGGSADPQPILTIRTARSGERIVATFSDNGPGITSPQQVFDHFYTTKPVGHGTGLGLSISHAIIERHAGEIAAENLPGGGACFTIELPARAAEGSCAATDAPQSLPLPVAQRSIPASVLVVDDEPSVLELQMAILDSVGASPVGAQSGAEAIERLKSREFDLIVSDLRMPGAVSGKELFRWVEAHRPAAVPRFLFVTGDTIAEAEFLKSTPVRCLLKPFTMEEYLSSLRETLHAQRAA